MKKNCLTLVGMPLDDEGTPSPEATKVLSEATLIIGENKKSTWRYLKRSGLSPAEDAVFFLDPPREMEEIEKRLRSLQEGHVVLFSETGMPVLFDPGSDILSLCRQIGYEIRSCPSATSWGTACALSGFSPPFHIEGFLPREETDRQQRLQALQKIPYHRVLMETPYRFQKFLQQLSEAFGPKQRGFLALEIAKQPERLLWGTLDEILKQTRNLDAAEFVLILEGKS